MKNLFAGGEWSTIVLAAVLGLTVTTVCAHEGREVEGYRLVVGWMEEPTYEAHKNAVQLRVMKLVASGQSHQDSMLDDSEDQDGHHQDSTDEDSMEEEHSSGLVTIGGKSASPAPQMHDSAEAPVEGLQETLQVEITHVSSASCRVLELRAVLDDPGHYAADLIPTVSGVYEFRVFGTIEGTEVDETFVSKGGGGSFDDVRVSAAIQFPVQLPETRELESAVQGCAGHGPASAGHST